MRTYTLIETMKCIGLSKAIYYVPICFFSIWFSYEKSISANENDTFSCCVC